MKCYLCEEEIRQCDDAFILKGIKIIDETFYEFNNDSIDLPIFCSCCVYKILEMKEDE